MYLSEVELNVPVRVQKLYSVGKIKERLLSLGFTAGALILPIRKGPSNNLTVYVVRGVMIALRIEEAQKIEVGLEVTKLCD